MKNQVWKFKAKLYLAVVISILLLAYGCGKQGDRGSPGVNGPTGAPGAACSLTPNSDGATILCPGGEIQTIINGQTGPTGPNGLQGIPGTNGTSVYVVQFCSNIPTVYPSSFPEQGLCIDDSIYAVYWDKANLNAWLALIPPGLYQSTATGLQCTFNVEQGCIIN